MQPASRTARMTLAQNQRTPICYYDEPNLRKTPARRSA